MPVALRCNDCFVMKGLDTQGLRSWTNLVQRREAIVLGNRGWDVRCRRLAVDNDVVSDAKATNSVTVLKRKLVAHVSEDMADDLNG